MRNTILAIAAAVFVAALTPALSHAQVGNPFDHLKCYKIVDPKDPAKIKYTADLVPLQGPPFNVEPGCLIKTPAKLFCIPVQKTNVQPTPPGGVNGTQGQDYLLYKIKCPHPVVVKGGTPLIVVDQFGTRTVSLRAHQLLLVPAFKQSNICHNQALPGAPVCGGDCVNPNAKCVNLPGTTVCTCAEPCGIDAAGQCDGMCPFSDQVCDFVTDASGVLDCRCAPLKGCGRDPVQPGCSGECPDPAAHCVANSATGNCDCVKPCGSVGIRKCGGLCPTPTEACVVMANDAGCECRQTQPQPCGLQGTQCGGTCPNNELCRAGGPIPGPGCVCGPNPN
jgi:hypothetical protein